MVRTSRIRSLWAVISALVLLAMLVSACAPAATPAAPAENQPSAQQPAGDKSLKFALILPGTIQDSDYNTVGYKAMLAVKEKYGIETAYSEQVPVADAERVAREYIGGGYNVVGFHGGQFLTAVQKLSAEFPDVAFIIETGGDNPNLPANVWNIGRKYYLGAYPLGVLAARMTKTNKVGWICGVKLPDFIAVVNTLDEAVKATNPDAKFVYSFTGDQNDPVKARQTAETMIADGVDFIIMWLNNGNFGILEAAKGSKDKVLLTTFYTDKTELAPDNFTTSLLFEFDKVFIDIFAELQKGKMGGYYEMKPGSGLSLSPLTNTPEDVSKEVMSTFDKIASGELKLEEKNKEILVK